jgi:hypothetical protein
MDPRVNTPAAGLKLQFDLATEVVAIMNRTQSPEKARLNGQLVLLLGAIVGCDAAPTPQMAAAVKELQQRAK